MTDAISETCPEKATESHDTARSIKISDTTGFQNTNNPLFSVFTETEKKWISYAASYAAMFSGLSTFIYYPAIVPLGRDLSVSLELINLTITSYLVVAGVAPAFMGDMADQTGRRPVYLLTFSLYVAANIGLALQSSFPALLVLRMVQSAGSSGTFAAAYGVIADIATPSERGSYVGILIMFTCTAPSLGPVLGGILAEKLGWRWIFWLLVIMSGAHLIILALFFPETSRKIVHNGSVQARGIHRTLFSLLARRGSRSDKSEGIKPSEGLMKRKIRIPNPLTSIPILFHKNSLAIILVGSIYYTVSRTLGASLSAQCIEIYDLNYLEAGLVYLPTGLAGMISSYSTAKLGRDTNLRVGEDNDDFPVEKTRLRSVWYLIIISSAATLGYGWALYKRAHIAVPLVMQFLSGLSITSIFTICGTLLTDLNSNKSSTAQAAYNLVRCVGAGGGVAALQPIINGVGLGWGFTLYAFFCLTSVPVLWILQTKGMKWRVSGKEG
ncbi:hypothetical protein D8B26_002538 [Coccidioides posadasii str. Silveira]|uniref:Uncharacterized protein n=1 Tax=Coccidioides posadasii (strain RMSCC 757 / Silveira) TaxID=443226 RepID=E9DIW7_COCPS|nr:conserved hypothetical protein [Coccidioides posadasii str. Silveira]QVM07844.1 hypothetical protein D8B26_002538 [Coccidioides posadasii str. Silveira]